jgi:hypothetical protein
MKWRETTRPLLDTDHWKLIFIINPTYYFCGIYLILHLVSAHDDGLGCLGIGRRTLANKQTGQPNWAADEKYDQVRIVEIAIQ